MYGESEEYLAPQRPFPSEFVMPLTDSKGRVLATAGARAGAVNPVFGKVAERQKELEMMRLELEKQAEDKLKKQEAYFERKLAEMQTDFSKQLAGNIEKKKAGPKKKEKVNTEATIAA